jgi:hypothetical protein
MLGIVAARPGQVLWDQIDSELRTRIAACAWDLTPEGLRTQLDGMPELESFCPLGVLYFLGGGAERSREVISLDCMATPYNDVHYDEIREVIPLTFEDEDYYPFSETIRFSDHNRHRNLTDLKIDPVIQVAWMLGLCETHTEVD